MPLKASSSLSLPAPPSTSFIIKLTHDTESTFFTLKFTPKSYFSLNARPKSLYGIISSTEESTSSRSKFWTSAATVRYSSAYARLDYISTKSRPKKKNGTIFWGGKSAYLSPRQILLPLVNVTRYFSRCSPLALASSQRSGRKESGSEKTSGCLLRR